VPAFRAISAQREGLLKASIAAPAGGERILAILGPGSVVGELSMIDGGPRSASVTALRDSKLSFVGRSAFEAFGQTRPDLYRHVASLLARRLRDTDDALVATNFLSVKGRVARAFEPCRGSAVTSSTDASSFGRKSRRATSPQ
jgi:CRP/FNR family cyclic AMP-dependent transcriptional regulator